ncbi:hypothetical protein Ahy_A08g040189 [Arachis hypogaea]|uniref:FAR1 domain-containing protein n=1 Tax=Arachis hypogaea TaxID=3818 RepID=A0A445BZ42_ARAHY|nr:hypothetical protein Ahy_A08g040189 [Arachis hypogaea]
MEERVFFDEMIEESDDTEKFQEMYQDKIEQEAVNSDDLGEQEFQAMFDENDFSHQIAFDFYNYYVKSVGFGARKSKTWKNSKGEYVKRLFVCSHEGFRPEKYYNMKNRKRELKYETHCGCLTRFVVRFVAYTGRWHMVLFVELHNHDCLDLRLVGFLPTHRKMAEADANQMNNMKDVGIITLHIYMLANQAGGYENVNYTLRDMYNEIARRRRHVLGDARAALRYLKNQKAEDPCLYYEHIVDAKGVLQALFWCDGRSQLDYEIFGDVLAFDVTYKKNKYLFR